MGASSGFNLWTTNNARGVYDGGVAQEEAEFFGRCLVELANISTMNFNFNRLNATTVGPRIGSGDVVTPEYACERISLLKRSSNEVLGRIAQMTVFFVYGLLMVVGVVTNLSVAFVAMRHSQARTSRNLFVLNLILCDVSVCLVTMPFTMLRLINGPSWTYGDGLCKLTSILEGANLLVSSLTASAIAVHRLCLITRRTAKLTDVKCWVICLVICLIWLVSILGVLPAALFTGTSDFYFPETNLLLYHVCSENWPNNTLHLTYSVVLMLLQYLIPISVIFVTHARIISIVSNRSSAKTIRRSQLLSVPTDGSSRASKIMNVKRNRKTTKILLIIALCFVISWSPYHIYIIAMDLNRMGLASFEISPQTELILFFVVHAIAMSSTISNAILYGWLNSNLQGLFRATYSRRCCMQGSITNTNSFMSMHQTTHQPSCRHAITSIRSSMRSSLSLHKTLSKSSQRSSRSSKKKGE